MWYFITLAGEKCTSNCMHVVGAVSASSVQEAIEYATSRVNTHGMRLEAVPEYAAKHEASPPEAFHRGWKKVNKRWYAYSAYEIELKISMWRGCRG